jgi:hypothetical protein
LTSFRSLPRGGKQHARKRDKSHTDIADKMKIFLREEQSADPRSDGLPDVKHGRIERDGRTRQIRRSRDEPRCCMELIAANPKAPKTRSPTGETDGTRKARPGAVRKTPAMARDEAPASLERERG